jgi:hypothetical protein
MTCLARFRPMLLALTIVLLASGAHPHSAQMGQTGEPALPQSAKIGQTGDPAQPAHSPDFERAQRKFAWIAENGKRAAPSTAPTVLTASEWNDYLNEGGVQLPPGLSDIRITSEPGTARAQLQVDFDRLTANRTRSNPLLFLFTGTHQVAAVARAEAADGVATIHIQSVVFDGLEIPRLALEYFASHFLRPKYGNAVSLDSSFRLPDRIDTAVVGANRVTITQR